MAALLDTGELGGRHRRSFFKASVQAYRHDPAAKHVRSPNTTVVPARRFTENEAFSQDPC